MPKIRKKFIIENIDENYYHIINNINDLYAHKKINDGTPENQLIKSGFMTKSKGKSIKEDSSEMGTLPASCITSGKILQNFNDPFDETNMLIYNSNQSNTNSNKS